MLPSFYFSELVNPLKTVRRKVMFSASELGKKSFVMEAIGNNKEPILGQCDTIC